jgi:hypothetical protein
MALKRTYIDTAGTTFNNTAAEQTLATTTLPTPSVGQIIRVTLYCQAVNNSVTTRQFTHRLYIGTVALVSTATSIGAGVTVHGRAFEEYIVIAAGASGLLVLVSTSTGGAPTITDISGSPITVKSTGQFNAADTNLIMTNQLFIVEVDH